MKTINLNKIVLFALSLLVFNACVQDDDFDTPNVDVTDPVINGNIIDIDAVIGNLIQSGEDIITFEETNNFMEGYVISSDEGGNFFEELVLQDKAENPTAGIVVQVDVNPLFTIYDFGRKVYIKLDGLSVAVDNGVVQIGRRDGNELAKIAASEMSETILRTSEVATIVPLEVSISDFSNDLESLYIRLTDVQFNRNDVLGDDLKTFAAEDTDQFDGERVLESCATSSSVILSTSTFSDFKSLLLPANRGSIDGVLTRDFFDEFYTLVINSPEDINFTNEVRCDPIELSCGLASTTGMNNLFADDFESQSTNSLISGNGWTNFIEAGSEGWEAYTQGGTNSSQGVSARVGSFNSGDASTVAWLITPEIDLDANSGVTLNFETSNSFSDGSTLEVLFSNDWDGTEAGITTATWGIITDAYVTQDSDFFGEWFESGNVDLTCGSGQIYIAFKYVGSGQSDFDGTYELDFVSIDAQ
ncbi:DUF5689 domain-containing protein [uncultured Psychroserpens sp.]|uniref:DUF5689 domain-containing protein n=1 Tax=uncultured Psychroserpens sp. TaxID=255436 RepID=UPI0026103BFA|nr:DUF5689 domain-containing protein [uncultured Psychroserpens sp.]